MDWILIAFLLFLVLCVVLIVIILATLPQLGDERKNLIKMKAQSYSFTVIIFILLYEIGYSIYLTVWTDKSYEGMDPFSYLIAISLVYLITLLINKKKYGD